MHNVLARSRGKRWHLSFSSDRIQYAYLGLVVQMYPTAFVHKVREKVPLTSAAKGEKRRRKNFFSDGGRTCQGFHPRAEISSFWPHRQMPDLIGHM